MQLFVINETVISPNWGHEICAKGFRPWLWRRTRGLRFDSCHSGVARPIC